MRFKKRITAVLTLMCILGLLTAGSRFELTGTDEKQAGLSAFQKKETIYFWYADEGMSDYFNSAAVEFGEKKNVRVIPVLKQEGEFVEAVNRETLYGDHLPDVYLMSNDSLEKAFLAGLASEIHDKDNVCSSENFSQTALNAVTYHGRKVAYPFSFETTVLLYNATYQQEWLKQQPQQISLDDSIPRTIDDILDIGNTFDVPEGVEGIFKWDVSDIFYNYWFIGDHMIVGGECGDDEANIDIDNPESMKCLEVYKNLNQFFSIESDTVSFDSVVQDFIDGKIVFTIATTDILKKLEKAEANGQFAYEYGVCRIPAVSKELDSRSLSVTGTIVINGYSGHKELANEFASFLVTEYSEDLYERTGIISADLHTDKENDMIRVFKEEYADSISLPKMMVTSNYWMQLEGLFAKVWNGQDEEALVAELSRQIQSQISMP